MKRTEADEPAEAPAAPVDEPAWLRLRRLRQAELEALNEHGRQLMAKYGYGPPRQRFAVLGHGRSKRRRRR